MSLSAIASTGATIAILLCLGGLLGLANQKNFAPRWLGLSALLLLINDLMLTRVWGLVPDLAGSSDWNWMGKIMALIATLAIAAHPAIGWSKAGLTLRQNPQGRTLTYGVMLLTVMLFGWLALSQPNEPVDMDTLAFQLTMPGLEEETFYRGLLLLALNEAFRGRWQIAGIGLGWGGVISTFLFGLTHALGYSEGAFSFDIMSFAMTGVPALILLWVRERTGSVVWPIILHNFANSASHLI